MRYVTFLWLVLLFAAPAAMAEPVELKAADGVVVYGEYWPAADRKAPLILAFHQAGASHAEYAVLASRFNRAGFGVLAIDQRSGDGEFGGKNRTVAGLGGSASYDAALPDLEAALAWGRKRADGAPVIVLGSSYSAALVFLLVAKHPAEVQGLLAFSPGEYLDKPGAVNQAARSVRVPVFITQAKDEEEVAASRALLAALPGSTKTLFIAAHGVHGASTLRSDRNAPGMEENWAAVLRFLAQFKSKAGQ